MIKERHKYVVGTIYGDNNMLLAIVGSDSQRCKVGRFRCKCGREFEARVRNIISGGVKGCGCLRSHNKTHGLADKHPLYNTWVLMRARCYNYTNKIYQY